MPLFDTLDWSERDSEHFARHGIREENLICLLDGRVVVSRNKRRSRGDYVIIGRGCDGSYVTAIVEATSEPASWHVLTAWCSSTTEVAAYKRGT